MTNWDAKPLKLSKPQLLITVKQSSALIRAAFQRGVAEGKKEALDELIEQFDSSVHDVFRGYEITDILQNIKSREEMKLKSENGGTENV